MVTCGALADTEVGLLFIYYLLNILSLHLLHFVISIPILTRMKELKNLDLQLTYKRSNLYKGEKIAYSSPSKLSFYGIAPSSKMSLRSMNILLDGSKENMFVPPPPISFIDLAISHESIHACLVVWNNTMYQRSIFI